MRAAEWRQSVGANREASSDLELPGFKPVVTMHVVDLI